MNRTIKTILISISCFVAGLFVCSQILMRYEKEQAASIFFVATQHYENKDYEKAIALLNRSLAKNPDYYASYHLLGEIYFKKGENDMAYEMLVIAKEKIGEGNNVDANRISELLSDLVDSTSPRE